MKQPQTSHPIRWSDKEYQQFGNAPQISAHRYNKLPLFEKDVLINLLDNYPRKHLQCHTMGTDPLEHKDWQQVDIAENTTGSEIWQAVENGRLWLNLVHIEQNRQEYRELIDDMYAHLNKHCPHLENPTSSHSALLISSPGAQVYYHLDAEANMLWHIHGQKEVWIYPAMDSELTPQHLLEDIYAGEIDEDLPYRSIFDKRALYHRLQPGETASWPHNAPHRVVNVDMNVSLTTSYYTPAVYRRQYVQLANRFILRNLGFKQRSTREDGIAAASKRMAYRIVNKIRPFTRHDRSADYITDLQVDPTATLGFRKLPDARHASFSRQRR